METQQNRNSRQSPSNPSENRLVARSLTPVESTSGVKSVNEVIKKHSKKMPGLFGEEVASLGKSQTTQKIPRVGSSQRVLGPGAYNLRAEGSSSGFQFSNLPRFADESSYIFKHFLKNPQKKREIINKNRNLASCTPEKKQIELLQRAKERRLKEVINMQTRRLLESEKHIKLLNKLTSKQNRMEIRMHKAEYFLVKLAWSSYTSIYGVSIILFNKMNARKALKLRISKRISMLFYLSKALGKFMISFRKAKKKRAWGLINRMVSPLVKFKFHKHRKEYVKRIDYVLNRLTQRVNLSIIMGNWKFQIQIIQKHARNMLVVNQARQNALMILWNSVSDYYKDTEAIKNYSSHSVIQQLNKYIYDKKKRYLEIIDRYRIIHNNPFASPTLCLYSRAAIEQMVKSIVEQTKTESVHARKQKKLIKKHRHIKR